MNNYGYLFWLFSVNRFGSVVIRDVFCVGYTVFTKELTAVMPSVEYN